MGHTLPRFEKAHGESEGEIRRRILQAIFEQRLPPGERLREEQLATAFDVSRTVVRQVVARLAQDGILVQSPNVGSTVASPSRIETRDILDVRRMVEPDIVRVLAANPNQAAISRLKAHLSKENSAKRKGKRGTLVRLTGEFHLLLAEIAGNKVLIRLMTGLQALTCLAILLYAEKDEACPPDEHSKIIKAIAAGDRDGTAACMLHRLEHVERDLQLDVPNDRATMTDTLAWMRGRI